MYTGSVCSTVPCEVGSLIPLYSVSQMMLHTPLVIVKCPSDGSMLGNVVDAEPTLIRGCASSVARQLLVDAVDVRTVHIDYDHIDCNILYGYFAADMFK